MSDALTVTEIRDLAQLEAIIERDKESFVRCGQALMQIRVQKLYRRDYTTFEGYCQEKWGWSASYGRKLCLAAEFWEGQKLLVDMGGLPESELPKTERQAREAKKRDQRSSPDTSNKQSSSSHSETPTKPPIREPEKDDTGYPIPKEVLPYWERRDELGQIMHLISQAKTAIQKGKNDNDPLFAKVPQDAIDHLARTYQQVSNAKPYAVCTTCQGRFPDKCMFCKGTGLISRMAYERQAPRDIVAIREKAYNLKAP